MSNMDILEEWPLVDEQGRRYRKVGEHCREYMPELVTAAGTFPPGTIVQKVEREKPRPQRKDCPFAHGLNTECRDDCAFFEGTGCNRGIVKSGKICPLTRRACNDNCMMFENGRCGLIGKGVTR